MARKKIYKGNTKKYKNSAPVNEKIQIVCVLDSSGSMAATIDEARSGFNDYINEQRKLNPKTLLTTAVFHSHQNYEIIIADQPLSKVKPITEEEWYPRGMTALYDAIGKTIVSTRESHKKMGKTQLPNKVLFVIVTDGAENDSREFKTNSEIQNMIKDMEENHNWSFVFLSSDLSQSAKDAGALIGISSNNTLSFSNDIAGTTFAYDTLSDATRTYSTSTNSVTHDFFNPEDKESDDNEQ